MTSGPLFHTYFTGDLSNSWTRAFELHLITGWTEVEVTLRYDRRSVGKSVLVSGSHLPYCGTPALTRGRVCNLLYNCFWPLPEQSLWDPSPAELKPYFTVSFETPPTWRARYPYLYPPGTGWSSYSPGHWVPSSSLTTRRSTVEVF
jgi:hypothetical protein